MKQVSIHLYSFFELSRNAERKAINEHREFLLDTLRPDYIDGITDWDDPEKMEMYRAEYQYILENDGPVIESIAINEYWFFHDGTLANCTTYTAGPRKGETILAFAGESYMINEGEN